MLNVPQMVWSFSKGKPVIYLGCDMSHNGYSFFDGEKEYYKDSKDITHFINAEKNGETWSGPPILFNKGSAGYFDKIVANKKVHDDYIKAIKEAKFLVLEGKIIQSHSKNCKNIVKPLKLFGDKNYITINLDLLGFNFYFDIEREERLWWDFKSRLKYKSRRYPFSDFNFWDIHLSYQLDERRCYSINIDPKTKAEVKTKNTRLGANVRILKLSIVSLYNHCPEEIEWFKWRKDDSWW